MVILGSVTADPENNALILMEQRFILSRQTDLKKLIILFDIHNALVIDNTGAFTTHEALSRHLVSKG
jgi:glyceraldehyde 3-phosphate dehydrogenase